TTFFSQTVISQVVSWDDSWGEQGITMVKETRTGIKLNYSVNEFSFISHPVDGEQMKSVVLSGVFLPNEEGAPNLPALSRYVMIPAGAQVSLKISSSRTEVMKDVLIAPAPRIPIDTDKEPLHFEKDMSIYTNDAFYPAQSVLLSDPMKMRGVDVVMLGISPFRYNPVSKELIIYRDMEIEITFEGGTDTFGEERLRSRWWDQVIDGNVLNADLLPEMDYNKRNLAPSDSPDYEYIIITSDNPDFLAWADTIKKFRTEQGILTGIVTTTEIGGNTVSAIESYVDNAYNSWTVAPSAVLLLGDYGTASPGITSQWYVHPAGYPDFVSDNRFADVTGNDLPDIAFARITANNADELEVMITKFLDYERNPPTNTDFYDHPITALGWQTERWFQICSEVVGGYLKNVQGKNPVRINAVYTGNPTSDPWSTATNTSTVLNYFGPNGLGYIPATPQELGGFSGGTATNVVNAINDGSYMLQHRDHGMYTGWGEPAFTSTSISSLHNINNELPFIFSINCQTGAFHRSTESFAEKFHRFTYNGQNSGALGIIAATEVSYSFVNDVYVWGLFDNLFPDFMPDKATTFPVNYAMPAFGNAAGKHFLYQSSWPYNTSDKQITYRLFHHHGDAFLTLYTEVPQALAVNHAPVLQAASTTFEVSADAGSLIALTLNGEILATANGTGSPMLIAIPQQNPGTKMIVTVTKQNYFRYSSVVDVITSGLFAQFSANQNEICSGNAVGFTDQSVGSPTSWSWTFPGGNPSTYSGQFPPAISYSTPGTFDVILTVSDATNSDTQTKTDYITVNSMLADFSGNPAQLYVGNAVNFTDNSSCNPTSWNWTFPGGTPSASTAQNPNVTYNAAGVYDVTLVTSNGITTDTETKAGYITVGEVPLNYCTSQGSNSSYEWIGQVAFDAFTHASGASGYTDFTNLEIDLTAGELVNVTLTPTFSGTSYVEFWKIWIDYNRDGDFDDAGEEVFAPASGNSTINGSFTASAYAAGKTRMRVSMKWNATQTACETFSYGEVEDYTVSFASALPPVADFAAGATTIFEDKTVSFADLSTNSPTSWAWTFEGATPATSSQQNPTVNYTTAGIYSVSLTVSNAAGSDTETKTAYITVLALPGCAGIVAPANGSSGIVLSANLEWTTAANADGYKLFFGTDNPPTNLQNGSDLGNVTYFNPVMDLNYSTTYFWSLSAYNENGETPACEIWSFTTEAELILPPACASLIAPANGAPEVLISDVLEWNAVADADGYKIYFGTDNPPTNIENGSDLGNVSMYDPAGDLAYSTTYFWKVLAYNAGGDATGCATWTFTTEAEPVILPPACATLIAPANGAPEVLISDVLEWNAVADANGYKIYFGTDNPPTNIENGSDLGNVSMYDPAGDLAYSTTYFWKVVAYNAGGDATGCATWIFTTEAEPSGPTELLYTDFESGFGLWTSGGADCLLYTSGTYASQGNNAGNIQDNSGVASSFYLTNGIDVHTSGYYQIDIQFNFIAISMDNSAEDFWVQYFDGTTWHTLAAYAQGIDFVNGTFYSATVTILEAEYNFPANMNIRFMCDASGNVDDVYIDEIRITALNTPVSPECVSVISPSDGGSGVSTTTGLEWTPGSYATGYKIYFGTDNPPANIANGLDLGDVLFYTPPADLDEFTTYYWKIVPYNVFGDAFGCPLWHFTTGQASQIDELSFSDFEAGWGIWTDGGGDCSLYTYGTYAPQGNNAANIQDNSGVASSFYLTNGIDVQTPGYVQIDVEFEYQPVDMDNSSEDFWVQYFDGIAWNTVATYVTGVDFQNGFVYNSKVSILESQYNFPTGMKIRFMCDASANTDDVYIDMIKISASKNLIPDVLAKGNYDETGTTGIGDLSGDGFKVYPNPANQVIHVETENGNGVISVYTMHGELMQRIPMTSPKHTIDISTFENGMYILHVVTGGEVSTHKFIKN
ncbi:MAG: PKD domain-containing protein, partial [Bacteroidales bacterium]|nr:PKD domain-containing protein [Bacteroidales bacterium]